MPNHFLIKLICRSGATVLLAAWVVAPLHADSPPAALESQADAAYALRSDLSKSKMAIALYDQAIATDPQNAEIYWKASRNLWWAGENSEPVKEKTAYFEKGITLAEKGIQLDPNSVGAHFYLGCNDGSYGEVKGIMKSLSLVKPIRHEMAEVIRINGSYENGGAYQTLGVLDYQVPGLVGGNKKRALVELQTAEAINTNDAYVHYYLAEYYIAIDEKDKARAELQTLKSLTVPSDAQPDLLMMQKRGETLANQL